MGNYVVYQFLELHVQVYVHVTEKLLKSCPKVPVAEVEESSTFATCDILNCSTVSTLGAHTVHVHSTTCAQGCRKHEKDCEPCVAAAARRRCRKSHVASQEVVL